MKKALKAIFVAGTAMSVALLTATSAHAWEGDFNGNGGGAAGTLNYLGKIDGYKRLDVDLHVVDSISDGYCARVKIISDIPVFPDDYVYSPMACGYQTAKRWDTVLKLDGDARGVKVHMCRVHSDGSGQSCSSELYIGM